MNQLVADELRFAWSEVDRLRAFVRSLEWAGETVVYYDGFTAACCPSCGGIKPGEETYSPDQKHGHKADCELVAMLALRTPQTGSTPRGE